MFALLQKGSDEMFGKRMKVLATAVVLTLTLVTSAVPPVVLAAACSGSGGGC
jgi:hypothetical protein